MKAFILATALLSLSAVASAATVTVKVPAADLSAAAQSIVPKSAPFYKAEGSISCQSLNSGRSRSTSSCTITLAGRQAKVGNADAIIDAVQEVAPDTGPSYKLSGPFVVTSNSSDFSPYKTTEKASVTVTAK